MNSRGNSGLSPKVVRDWLNRVPLTAKSIIVTVFIGLLLWGLLDYVQSSKLQKIFHIKLFEELSNQSMEYRLRIDRYIRFHHETSQLIVSQSKFSDYISMLNRNHSNPGEVTFINESPAWFPKTSVLRTLVRPRFALLFDGNGKIREGYSRHMNQLPPEALLKPSELLLLKSQQQSLITNIDNNPYLVTTELFKNTSSGFSAMLMLASPIDEEFLRASLGDLAAGHFVALLTPGQEPTVVISSDHFKIPPGSRLSDLEDRYIITGHHTYDYGSAEYLIKLVSLMAMKEVDKLTDPVISTGRYQRNIIAPVFILTFALFMVMVTRRINNLNKKISDFSIQTLGTSTTGEQKGDQLHILEKRFHRLTEEVIEARELIRKQAEEKTRLIVNNAFDAIITLDRNGAITSWNPQAENIFGWSRQLALEQSITDIIVSHTFRNSIFNAINNYINSGNDPTFNKQVEVNALRRNGSEFPAELAITPARSGNSFMFIAIVRDITERKQMEYALIEGERKFRNLVETSSDWVWEVDENTIYTYASPKLYEILGYKPSEVIGKTPFELMPEEDKKKAKSKFDAISKAREPFHMLESKNIHKDGKLVILETSGVPIYDKGGTFRGYRGMDRDITERKQQEDKIKSSLREKEVLLKEIHHRVKNNMQVISSLLNMQSSVIDNKQYLDMFNESKNRIRSMALVHEKLYKSTNLENIDFNDYIQSLSSSLMTFYDAHSANVLLNINVENVSLSIDTAIPCGLIINELLTNALKYAFNSDKRGEITLSLSKYGSDVKWDNEYELIVKDNGVGIPENIDIRHTQSLGLQLVINLVEHQLQGEVSLDRSNGSEFHIRFKELKYEKRL